MRIRGEGGDSLRMSRSMLTDLGLFEGSNGLGEEGEEGEEGSLTPMFAA